MAPRAAVPAASASALIDSANLLLFSVQLDGLTLTDSLAAYGEPDDPLLPLSELVRLLELDVEVQPSERKIIGRIGEARRSLVVDLPAGTARSGARVVDISPADFVVTPAEIYLRTSAAQRLLPIRFEVDAESLAIKLIAQELLPIQGRLQRLARLRDASPDVNRTEEVLNVDSPYRLFTPPAFDVALSTGMQTKAPRDPLRYDLRIGADVLYTGFQGYVGSDDRGAPATSRFLFERRSLDGRLLGPLHAHVVGVGDVFTPSLPLGPHSIGGRGFFFSTAPLEETSVFNQVDLRGELPLGYDVELYVNDVLRSGQNTPAKGRYEFLKIPLTRGVNVIRIVTYGPRGERSEQTRIVNVGGGQLKKGQATFDFGLVEQEMPLFQVRRPTPADLISLVPGGLRMAANVNYGLTQFLTVSAGAALFPPTAGQERQVYTVGARTSIFGVSTQLDAAQDSAGGQGVALGLAGNLFGVSTVVRQAQFGGRFLDENSSAGGLLRPVQGRTELTLDGNLDIHSLLIPLTVRGVRNGYVDGSSDTSASFRASTSAAGVLLSTGLEYQLSRAKDGASNDTLSGYFAGSAFRDYKWQLRAAIDYQLLPDVRARTLAITADREFSQTTSLRLGLGQPLDNLEGVNLTATGIIRLRFADLALTGDYNNADQSWRVGLQLNFGLGYNPVARRYQMTRPGAGSAGSVLFHAFVDENGDGVFNPGEKPVSKVAVDGGERKAVTGPDGRALLTGLGGGATGRVLVGLDGIDNPSVHAPPRTVTFHPRPGSLTVVEYPLRPTGEVMVRILLRRADDKLVGLSAAQIRLVDAKGHVAEAGTEFDGSASFQDLPVGVYRLELDPTQAKRLRMRLNAPTTVTIKGDGSFTPDIEAEVSFEPREQETAQDSKALEPS